MSKKDNGVEFPVLFAIIFLVMVLQHWLAPDFGTYSDYSPPTIQFDR